MHEQITEQQLAEWERQEKAASPGPWGAVDKENPQLDCYGEYSPGSPAMVVSDNEDWLLISGNEMGAGIPDHIDEANIAFVADARTAMPLLIAEVRRLRNALQRIADIPLNEQGMRDTAAFALGLATGRPPSEQPDPVATFKQLAEAAAGRWDGVDAAAWVAEQRGHNDEQQDPADGRHDAVTRLMAENDKLKTEIARLENECRGWNAETKAGFFRQADYIRKYQEENDRLQEQAELRRLSLLLEEQAAYNRMCHDEELRDVLDD